MEYKIALIPGDGIGPEIVREAKRVLDKVCEKYRHSFTYSEVLLGGASIDVHGVPLTEESNCGGKGFQTLFSWAPLAEMQKHLHGIRWNLRNVRKPGSLRSVRR